ncbi:hypothetical protein [Peribacillus loiseleuriae]|nr:hypothetical protein [Peribacillus loiseleuriae]
MELILYVGGDSLTLTQIWKLVQLLLFQIKNKRTMTSSIIYP